MLFLFNFFLTFICMFSLERATASMGADYKLKSPDGLCDNTGTTFESQAYWELKLEFELVSQQFQTDFANHSKNEENALLKCRKDNIKGESFIIDNGFKKKFEQISKKIQFYFPNINLLSHLNTTSFCKVKTPLALIIGQPSNSPARNYDLDEKRIITKRLVIWKKDQISNRDYIVYNSKSDLLESKSISQYTPEWIIAKELLHNYMQNMNYSSRNLQLSHIRRILFDLVDRKTIELDEAKKQLSHYPSFIYKN